jgi:hypothetical protein
MGFIKRFIVVAACVIPCLAMVSAFIGSPISTPAERHFDFSYVARIPSLPQDKDSPYLALVRPPVKHSKGEGLLSNEHALSTHL